MCVLGPELPYPVVKHDLGESKKHQLVHMYSMNTATSDNNYAMIFTLLIFINIEVVLLLAMSKANCDKKRRFPADQG